MYTAKRAIAVGVAGCVGAAATAYKKYGSPEGAQTAAPLDVSAALPGRSAQLAHLRQADATKPFDVLIIGGGATGTGCAVDALSR